MNFRKIYPQDWSTLRSLQLLSGDEEVTVITQDAEAQKATDARQAIKDKRKAAEDARKEAEAKKKEKEDLKNELKAELDAERKET